MSSQGFLLISITPALKHGQNLKSSFLFPFFSMPTSWASLPKNFMQLNTSKQIAMKLLLCVWICLVLVYGKFREELWDGYYHSYFSSDFIIITAVLFFPRIFIHTFKLVIIKCFLYTK